MKAKTIEDAQNAAKNFFEEYKKKHNYSSLESALDMDNTSLSYIFEYLSYLKQNNISKFSDELKKYKFFLDEDSCDKLGTQYINHKGDILNLIDPLNFRKTRFQKYFYIFLSTRPAKCELKGLPYFSLSLSNLN